MLSIVLFTLIFTTSFSANAKGGTGNLHLLDDDTDFGYQSFDIQIHNYTENTVSATDFADGYTEYTCNCGNRYKADIVPKLCPFDDIKGDKWYSEGVLYCYQSAYMAGISGNEFGYKDTMDRQMFAAILAKIDGAELSYYSNMSFSDVGNGKWYSGAIEWAYQNGYASGISTDENGVPVYGLKNPVTREQLALFFYTYSDAKGYDISGRADITGFADYGHVHDWAKTAMSWAVDSHLIAGTSETTLSPRDSATRATVALIIRNYVETAK